MKTIISLVLVLLALGAAQAQTSLKINESKTEAFFFPSRLQVNLATENSSKDAPAKVKLEIIDSFDRIVAQKESAEIIRRGTGALSIPVALAEKQNVREMLWHRLRYHVATGATTESGIIALSEVMPELFEIRVLTSEQIYAGMRFPVRVRAFHATREAAVPGVKINAALKIDLATDEDNLKITATGETDAEGFALLEFEIPPGLEFSSLESGEIEIVGEKNGLTSRARESLQTAGSRVSVFFLTDKPLYQPNQKFYVRGLVLKTGLSDAGATIVADRELEFTIKDEENTIVFRQSVQTSRFGVASIEWQIPESAKLGTYKIEVEADEELENAETTFKVSRYELPNFAVKTKSDKDFYLPGETTAEVTVDALYLFGKPVAGGKVRVVREGKREWNFSEQKWDVQEEAAYEGDADAEGKYVAKIDLGKAHEKLRASESEFEDLKFAAYFTDSSTNKTEQRRFDLRITKEQIHVYLTGHKGNVHNPRLPFTMYVATYAADGKPISCETIIEGRYKNEADGRTKTLAKIKTNAFGAGKIEFFAPKPKVDAKNAELELNVLARDAENRAGSETEVFSIDETARQILLRTDKSIYRQGDAVRVEILSSEPEETVFLDVTKNSSSLTSRQIRLKNGRAQLKIPFHANFKSNLTISAFFDDAGEAVLSSRGIIFPAPSSLQVEASADKNTYRPNEEATVNFAVTSPDKSSSEAALGVVVLDKAVEERARTDADFGATNIFQNFGSLLPQQFEELDLRKTISRDMQLAAEMAFERTAYRPKLFASDYVRDISNVFRTSVERQIVTFSWALNKHHNDESEHPTDEASLRRILEKYRIDFDSRRDPWGTAFKAYFSVQNRYDTVEIKSAGANKIFGDRDDFTAHVFYFEYFQPFAAKIRKALDEYHRMTGQIVRDRQALADALRARNIELDQIRDRWGEVYHVDFGMSGRFFTINFSSGGADKKFRDNNYYDDFWVWTGQFDYWAEIEQKIGSVLNRYASEKKTFPQTEAEFRRVLLDGGIDFDRLLDGWNRPFYIEAEVASRTGSRLKIENVADGGEKPKETFIVQPVTQRIATFQLRSLGANGVKDDDYYQDYPMSVFAGLVSEQVREDARLAFQKADAAGGKSVIYGLVKDSSEALVPNANVTIYNYQTQQTIEIKTNSEGLFMQKNLSSGNYSVKAAAAGFKTSVVNNFYLFSEKIGEVNLTLEAGNISETVFVVEPYVPMIETSSTSIQTNVTRQSIELLPKGVDFTSVLRTVPGTRAVAMGGGFGRGGFMIDGASGAENAFIIDGQEVANFRSGALNEDNELPPGEKRSSTPRLREYFPETLVWQPELVTDPNGSAQLKFRLADNITTWKLYAVASNAQGKVGVTAKEIRAFQPFFVDLDPPRFLTEGDRIDLPVQIRNYTKEKQTVAVEMAVGDWFSLLSEGSRKIEVASNASQSATFAFRARSTVDEGKQKVTAIADTDSDAIEKAVTVRPNGQEIVRTQSETFARAVGFDVDFPANALANTQKAELKIYPNLFSHVTESVGGLLRRPYGCGEQTISSTYPNLMILKFAKTDAGLRSNAQRFLKKGYERLVGYKAAGGGFTYWGKGEPDTSLTAYAYRFLTDAKDFAQIDESILAETRDWLIKKQGADGSLQGNLMQTAYFARTLARGARDENSEAALKKALNFLKEKTAVSNDAYTLALYGLAALDAVDAAAANEIAGRLEKSAVEEGGAIFWKLEGTTPFYGWGHTGQIETTSLALQLLVKLQNQDGGAAATVNRSGLVTKATLYLLKNKDRYGVWYSTQTTVNVLDAFLAAMSGNKNERGQSVEIRLGGAKIENLEITPDQIAPVIVNLNEKLNASVNRLEIQASGTSPLTAQLVASHYIDWKDANLSASARQMRLDYSCDRTETQIMQEINCAVEAKKTVFDSYGMMLAEIGLPPGAAVSRESLQKAMEADWSLSRYEILPDRIVVYLWSKPGGTRFNFKFKPRYGIEAQTPASFVYDYYNEEAKATVAPLKFTVR